MTLDIYAGFDLARLGPMELLIGATPVSITAGRYAHVTLGTAVRDMDDGSTVSYFEAGEYGAFAAHIKDRLDAVIGASPVWTVTWNTSTLAYTIARASTAYTLGFAATPAGNRAADALGFARGSTSSSALTHTSTRRPWYVIRSLMGGKSRSSDEYEPRNVGDDGESEDGSSYFTGRTITPLYWDFQVPLEPIEATHRHAATAAVPWTWQSFFDHVRGIEPIGVDDTNERGGVATVHKLRANAAGFSPSRIREDWDGAWTVALETRYLGEVPP